MEPILGISHHEESILKTQNQTPVLYILCPYDVPMTSFSLKPWHISLNERDSSEKKKAEETKDKQVSIMKLLSCYRIPWVPRLGMPSSQPVILINSVEREENGRREALTSILIKLLCHPRNLSVSHSDSCFFPFIIFGLIMFK